MSDKYRLIWFQHLQKAAGTSIIEMAIHNGETLYPTHINGNPYTPDGVLVPLRKMGKQELIGFIDQCQNKGVTFVATEFGAPSFSVLASDPRICLVTSMRDPLARFMSQFYYTFYTGRTDVSSPEEFVGSMLISTMSNYYCRIFSEFNDNSDPIGREQYEIARSTLSSFDCCTVLENRNPFAELYKLLDWESVELKANQTRLSFISVIKSLAKGRFGLLMRRVTHPRKKPNEEFREVFREENRWDYRLYETVRETS